jgi:hypothetical protein
VRNDVEWEMRDGERNEGLTDLEESGRGGSSGVSGRGSGGDDGSHCDEVCRGWVERSSAGGGSGQDGARCCRGFGRSMTRRLRHCCRSLRRSFSKLSEVRQVHIERE